MRVRFKVQFSAVVFSVRDVSIYLYSLFTVSVVIRYGDSKPRSQWPANYMESPHYTHEDALGRRGSSVSSRPSILSSSSGRKDNNPGTELIPRAEIPLIAGFSPTAASRPFVCMPIVRALSPRVTVRKAKPKKNKKQRQCNNGDCARAPHSSE